MNIIITGGHSGMGLELSKKLLLNGHRIGLIVRNQKRKVDTEKLFQKESMVDIFIADLSKREQIETVANEIKSNWGELDGIFNNAGVLLDKLYYSDYGNELQLEINAISPYLLTKALLPMLEVSKSAFVVSTVTSGLHNKKTIDIAAFKKPKKFIKLLGSYIDSKLILITLMNNLSKQLKTIRFVNVDPGAIKTKMTSGGGMPLLLKPIRNLFFKTPQYGADNLYKGAFNTNNIGSGIYLSGNKVKPIKVNISKEEIEQLLKSD
ncbi:SDR family NAD(P)-dependent oxidoreductase [uncultured Aquimarina sp.]|uniref:SDR family NAD(P)-dependent oxidoreductase n=1 Tax=uncultured Aquimarina sp. TaxID=575652 RepID=UPI002630063B|nr:SDR family NAD(P)-dependent oxidoreductase [uncultured Aquimarina sp.]